MDNQDKRCSHCCLAALMILLMMVVMSALTMLRLLIDDDGVDGANNRAIDDVDDHYGVH